MASGTKAANRKISAGWELVDINDAAGGMSVMVLEGQGIFQRAATAPSASSEDGSRHGDYCTSRFYRRNAETDSSLKLWARPSIIGSNLIMSVDVD